MKRVLLPIIAFAFLFMATGCDTVADVSLDDTTPETRAITNFSFKSIAAITEIQSNPEDDTTVETGAAKAERSAQELNTDSLLPDGSYLIHVFVPQDTDLTTLVPVITFEGSTISPDPLTVHNFTKPVQFTVTAEDETVAPRVYTVIVEQLKTAADWTFTNETFAQFAAELSALESGEYAVHFPAGTVLEPVDVFFIRDSLAKKENQNKLIRLDFTGCTFADNRLPQYAFNLPAKGKGITTLLSVILPEGLEHIEPFAFEFDKNLSSVKLPKSLKSIGEEAFLGCTSLSSVRIRKGVDLLGAWVFGHFTKEQTVIMEVAEAPKTWSPTWNYKCKAVIEWSADPEEEIVAAPSVPSENQPETEDVPEVTVTTN